jgi:hypothetical protein
MPQTCKTQPGQTAGLADSSSSLSSFDTRENAKNSSPAQAVCREMLRQNIADNVELLISQLDAAMAMARVPNDAGFIFGLRCAQALWRSIAADAKELASIKGATP